MENIFISSNSISDYLINGLSRNYTTDFPKIMYHHIQNSYIFFVMVVRIP